MAETEKPIAAGLPNEKRRDEHLAMPQRVYLDPSTPRVRTIVRIVVVTVLLLFVAGFLQSIISSLAYLFFLIVLSIFFAYLLDPVVQVIRRPFKARNLERFMPRSLAIGVAYLLLFSLLVVAIASIAPSVSEQARDFGANLPAYGNSIRERANDLNRRFDRLRIPDEVQVELSKKATDLGSSVTATVGNTVLVSVSFLPWFILVPVLAFFFLKDVNKLRLSILRMFPAGRWRYRVEVTLADVNTTLATYTRAQILSCIIIAFICTIGFYLLGLKYALLLGILAGIFEFIPVLGPLTIGIIVVVTASFSADPWKALYTAIFLIVLRIVHDYVTYPRIVRGGGIHLHPLAIILAVLAGEQVAGIPGVFIAIPLVAVATVIYRNVLEHQGSRGIVSDMIEEHEANAEEAA